MFCSSWLSTDLWACFSSGKSPMEALMIMVPEAYKNQPDLLDKQEITDFYNYYRCVLHLLHSRNHAPRKDAQRTHACSYELLYTTLALPHTTDGHDARTHVRTIHAVCPQHDFLSSRIHT